MQQVAVHGELGGRTVVDVGGGGGWFTTAFRARGAHCYLFEPDPTELHLRTDVPAGPLARILSHPVRFCPKSTRCVPSAARVTTDAGAPAGAGGFYSGFSTQTLAAGGTVGNTASNGWPTAQNVATITDPMPQIPGLDPMEPILGQLIEQNQNFAVVLDPTIAGVAAFTTLAAAPATNFVGTGINAHVYLEGVLARAIL